MDAVARLRDQILDDESDRLRSELDETRKALREAEAALVCLCIREGRIRLSASDVRSMKGRMWRLTSRRDDAGTVVIEAHEKPTTET